VIVDTQRNFRWWRRMTLGGFALVLAWPGISAARGVEPLPGTAQQTPPPEVEVVKRGSAPRSELRYSLTPGLTQRVVFTTNTSISQRIGDLEGEGGTPQTEFDITFSVGAPMSAGTLPVSFTYEAFRVEDQSAEDAAAAPQVKAAGEPIIGLTGMLTLTDRGEVLDSSVTVPPGLDAFSAQLVEQFIAQSRALTIPFPAEAVGRGARWNATTTTTFGSIESRQSARYELVRRRGEEVVVRVEVDQRAPRQTFNDPASGADVELLSSKGEGTGKHTLVLSNVVPTKSDLHISLDQKLRAQGRRISQTIDLNTFIDRA
jgi:hypothetical protein